MIAAIWDGILVELTKEAGNAVGALPSGHPFSGCILPPAHLVPNQIPSGAKSIKKV